MKTFKVFLPLLLALVLVFTCSISAGAADANLDGHVYKAFQVFSGTQSSNSSDQIGLADVAWGSGVNSSALLSALAASQQFPGITASSTAADVAALLSESNDDTALALAFARLAYANRAGAGIDCVNGQTNLDAGYYLVVDVTTFAADAENTVYNTALLQMTQKGTFEIRNKTSVPTLIKKVFDVNDSVNAEGEWEDSADYDIGDDVPFRLTVTLGDMSFFESYAIRINDKLCDALTVNPSSVVIRNGNADVTANFAVSASGHIITASCANVKAFAGNGSVLTVNYTAKLGENAKLGAPGNENEAYLEYSNNPNEIAVLNPGPGQQSHLGRTPKDLVRVFTYQLIVNKVDQDGNALNGAGFELLKKDVNGNYQSLGVRYDSGSSQFKWVGLDDGDYKVVETVTPGGYNSIDPIVFTLSASHEREAADPQLTVLSGGNTASGAAAAFAATANLQNGSLSADIVNEAGVVLPETGAAGSHLLYVFGSALLLGGLVLIVTRKRVSANF